MIDNDAKSMLLFNGRDVDKTGKPLLMKAVLRVKDPADAEGVKTAVEAFKKEMGNFEGIRQNWGPNAEKIDIKIIAANDAYVELKDMDEAEFQFGDPILQISQDKAGKELSRGVATEPDNKLIRKYYAAQANGQPNLAQPVRSRWNQGNPEDILTGANLDTTAPNVFDERISLKMSAKETFPEGGWLETRAEFVTAGLVVEPGLIFEPGKDASVTFLGTSLKTAVAKDDAYFTGSPSAEGELKLEGNFAKYSLKQLLTQSVTRNVVSQAAGHGDNANVAKQAFQFIYADAGHINIAGKAFTPLSDQNLKKAELGDGTKMTAQLAPIADPDHNGTRASIVLNEGFLKTDGETSIEGWTVAVGFKDVDGAWKQCSSTKIEDRETSQRMGFELDMTDAPGLMKQGASMEIRLFNQNGVPAERVQVPFQAMTWADAPAVDAKPSPTQQFSPSQVCGEKVTGESKLKDGGRILTTESGAQYFNDKGVTSPIDALQAKRLQSLK